MTQYPHTLDPKRADPFEAYHTVFRDKARLQWTIMGLLVSQLVLVLALVIVVMRPTRVIIKDRIDGRPPLLSATEAAPVVTVTDARVFYLNMVRLRYGWDSLTVDRDMRAYLGQCVSAQRDLERQHLQAPQTDDASPGAAPRSRLQVWMAAGLRNTVVLPEDLEDVACESHDGLWHCYMQATIVTQRLAFTGDAAPPPARVALFATLLEVPHTIGTPSGLVVGAMRQTAVPAGRERA